MVDWRFGKFLANFLVFHERLTIDSSIVGKAVAVRAKNDQIFGKVFVAAFPRNNVVDIDIGGITASLNCTPVPCLDKNMSAYFSGNCRSFVGRH